MRSAGRTPRWTRGALVYGAVAAGVAVLVTVFVTGCTSGSSGSPPPSVASTSGPASGPASVSAPGSASGSVPGSVPVSPASGAPSSFPGASVSSSPGGVAAAAPGCSTSGLQATAGLSQGALGSIYQVIDFTNISGAACTLFGYPGVALAGGTPVTQIGAAASRSTAARATLVTLAAGSTANALLRISEAGNYPTSSCHPVASTYLQIYPPNQTTPIYLAYKSTGCSVSTVPLLSIGVVQAGRGGSTG